MYRIGRGTVIRTVSSATCASRWRKRVSSSNSRDVGKSIVWMEGKKRVARLRDWPRMVLGQNSESTSPGTAPRVSATWLSRVSRIAITNSTAASCFIPRTSISLTHISENGLTQDVVFSTGMRYSQCTMSVMNATPPVSAFSSNLVPQTFLLHKLSVPRDSRLRM